MDKQLPSALQTIVTQICKLFAQIILLFVAQKWLAVSLPACMIVVYIVQKVYLRTSRQLRFLELEARAGVFSSFLESIEGLQTIRSFGWSDTVIQDNISSLDHAQRPEYLLLCLQRWLNIVLDLLAAAVATSVVAIAVVYRDRVSGAQVGIALNIMLVANTTLLKLVENWTTLEISLGAIARLKSLEEMTPAEGGEVDGLEPAELWPERGEVEFKEVTASYGSDSVALRNLNLTIKAGQKVIICGRTGSVCQQKTHLNPSGKSTILLTLLRLLELQSGSITLDGIDIKTINLDILRERCFITVPQDPLLLSNESLRFNLDPSCTLPNEILISALEKTQLWAHFLQAASTAATNIHLESNPHPHPILDANLSLLPSLSTGQTQLLALCRALVKAKSRQCVGRKPVVLLDEVTASLDPGMEELISGVVEEGFVENGFTVVCVAHRREVWIKGVREGRGRVVVVGEGGIKEGWDGEGRDD
ncbi:hypothetical protein CJF30_00010773 [Rutstroemia sp. NJR-2017a BBW]|nr:hypothetical protein CJF30_00010773 [Rutstroemia sp. NJR-2017a BBW]